MKAPSLETRTLKSALNGTNMPAPKGNTFARKDDANRVAFPVNVRGTETERKAWRRAAAGQGWNDWARAVLNAAAGHETT